MDLLHLSRALIEGAPEGLVREPGQKVIKKVLAAVNVTVQKFLSQALRTGTEQVALQLKAEELDWL